MPKDDAIGAPREIPANRLLLGLRTGLRSGAIGALRTQMTGVAGPLGLHARRESQALEPVTVLKAALDGARARTPANRHFRISMWGSDREPLVPLRTQMTEAATQMTGAAGPLGLRQSQAKAGREVMVPKQAGRWCLKR
jgi:hypothetical protein